MKIVLTTPFNPGSNDPGNTYPHIFIPRVSDAPLGQNLSFDWEYGTATTTTVANVPGVGVAGASGTVNTVGWVKGPGSFTKTATISGTAYLTIVNSSPLLTTDSAYGMILRQLYQYLITNSLVAGSISNP